ncbi:MAG: glutaredoxin family protein [Methylococcales bacterium]|nr:glutaredoxin family protein [Methylococcales bacterium]
MTAKFILFGTEGCHLCEDAGQVLNEAGINFQHADILSDEVWQEKFGLLIPVLWHIGSGRQLDWPFDSQQAQSFFQRCHSP